jgi:hypothetical protein
MTEQEWLKCATVFDLGTCLIHKRPVKLEARGQLDGARLWVVKMHEWVLGKDADWHWEPLPSSRSDEFLQLTRFASPAQAHDFWKNSVTASQTLQIG